MIKFCGLLALCFGLFACSSTGGSSPSPIVAAGCSTETLVTTAMAAAIASADGCANTSVMQSDIQGWLGSANLCSAAATQAQLKKIAQKNAIKLSKSFKVAQSPKVPAKGILGDIVCPIAVDSVEAYIGTAVPTTWGCTGSSSVSSAISAACMAVVPF